MLFNAICNPCNNFHTSPRVTLRKTPLLLHPILTRGQPIFTCDPLLLPPPIIFSVTTTHIWGAWYRAFKAVFMSCRLIYSGRTLTDISDRTGALGSWNMPSPLFSSTWVVKWYGDIIMGLNLVEACGQLLYWAKTLQVRPYPNGM